MMHNLRLKFIRIAMAALAATVLLRDQGNRFFPRGIRRDGFTGEGQ